MQLLFTEVEAWEEKKFIDALPDHELFFLSPPLTLDNLITYKNIDILSVFVHSQIDKTILQEFPKLKLIVSRSTGVDHIDTCATQAYNITVCNLPTYASQSVAEYTFGLLLCMARKIHLAYSQVQTDQLFSHQGPEGFELKGKTIGIIGLGKIGKIVGHIAKGFGMHILACDQQEDSVYANAVGCSYGSFKDILAKADILTLHVPLTPQTHHLINAEAIKSMKPGCYIINTARGGIIETKALLEGLNTGHIAGAALDVLENEEKLTPENKALIEHPQVIVSPHNAFNTLQARVRVIDETIDIIKNWIMTTN